MFDSTRKFFFEKSGKTVIPIVHNKKICVYVFVCVCVCVRACVCVSKFFIEKLQEQHKRSSKSRISCLTNSENLVELS